MLLNFEKLFIYICIIGFSSCQNDIDRIIKHKDEIIKLSKNKEIINDKERNFYRLILYSSDYKKRNEYYFKTVKEVNEISYTLFRDTIQFETKEFVKIDKNNKEYTKKICTYYQSLSKMLDSYGIKSLSGITYKTTPNLVFTTYLNNGKILLYMPNTKELFDDLKKIKEGWYMVK